MCFIVLHLHFRQGVIGFSSSPTIFTGSVFITFTFSSITIMSTVYWVQVLIFKTFKLKVKTHFSMTLFTLLCISVFGSQPLAVYCLLLHSRLTLVLIVPKDIFLGLFHLFWGIFTQYLSENFLFYENRMLKSICVLLHLVKCEGW